MKKKEEKTIYGTFVMLRGLDHIIALETDNYDEAFDLWKNLKEEWTACINESKPFEMISPIVTAFDPNLIYEITVRPVVETTSSNNHNPYKKAMVNHGFGHTLGNSQLLSDVKDGGYL
jgi:hypothetical protein